MNKTVEDIDQLIEISLEKIKSLKKIRFALKEKTRYDQDTLWYYDYLTSELNKLMKQDAEDYKEIHGEYPVWYRNVPPIYAMQDWIGIQHGKWNRAHGREWHEAILTCKVCNKEFPTEPAHDEYHRKLMMVKIK